MLEPIDRQATIRQIQDRLCVGCDNHNGALCSSCKCSCCMDIVEDMPAIESEQHHENEVIGMDKAKIMRLLDEADDIVSALYRQGANKDYKCKSLREKLQAISAEISEKPKSNADRIRQMKEEELAHWLNNKASNTCNICIGQKDKSSCTHYECEECVTKWLKQEVNEDATD